MIDPIDRWEAIGATGNATWAKERLMKLPSAQTDEMKDLIRAIRAGIVATSTDDIYSCGMRNGMRWCLGLVDDKEPTYENAPTIEPSVTPKQRWIPCHPSELPKNKTLWVTHASVNGYRWVSEAVYDMTEWSEDVSNVVAYMALNQPEPYREEGDE